MGLPDRNTGRWRLLGTGQQDGEGVRPDGARSGRGSGFSWGMQRKTCAGRAITGGLTHREGGVAEVQELLQVVVVAVRIGGALHRAERQQVLQLVAPRQLQRQRRLRGMKAVSAATHEVCYEQRQQRQSPGTMYVSLGGEKRTPHLRARASTLTECALCACAAGLCWPRLFCNAQIRPLAVARSA